MTRDDSIPATRDEARRLGVSLYRTGRQCSRGHTSARYVSNAICVECSTLRGVKDWQVNSEKRREESRAWREKNQGRIKERGKAYRQENGEKLREKNREWRRQNQDLVREKNADYRTKHVAELSRYHAEYRGARREESREYAKKWRAENPEKARALSSNNYAARRDAEGSHTAADIRDILRMQGHKCAYCRVKFTGKKYQIDHIAPIAKGGSNYRSNLQALCFSCNSKKRAKDPLLYARTLGLLL